MKIKNQAKLSLFTEFRYSPYYEIIDKHGALSDLYHDDYSQILISPGRELILQQPNKKTDQKQIKIKADSFSFSITLCSNFGFFGESFKTETEKFLSLIKIKEINWIGMREFQLYNIENQSIPKLITEWRGKFFPNNIPFENFLGSPVDVGINVNFKNSNYNGNLNYGFTEKAESKKYFSLSDEQSIPNVGLFVDLDIFKEDPKISDKFLESLMEHINKVSDIMQQVDKAFSL